ncbi:MAG: hypothetical protein N3E37_05385 [Candidatus Micrarchaeota archaeon]|nr:hypothetical protein [Candidatus Micrarchaeota archaeon]
MSSNEYKSKKPVILISTSKPIFHLGESLLYKVQLNFDREINVRGIYAFLVYTETKKVKQYRQMTDDEVEDKLRSGIPVGDRTVAEDRIKVHEHIVSKHRIAGEGKYFNQRFLGNFFIKDEYPHTTYSYDVFDRIITWYIRIKLDIPFAPDMHAEKEVVILPK